MGAHHDEVTAVPLGVPDDLAAGRPLDDGRFHVDTGLRGQLLDRRHGLLGVAPQELADSLPGGLHRHPRVARRVDHVDRVNGGAVDRGEVQRVRDRPLPFGGAVGRDQDPVV